MINEVSRRKTTAKAEVKATSQEDQIHQWKQHFENLLGNPLKVTHEPIMRIIRKQLDIKLEPFTLEELDLVLRKIKIEKQQGLMKYPQKYGRRDNSTTYYSNTLVYLHTHSHSHTHIHKQYRQTVWDHLAFL